MPQGNKKYVNLNVHSNKKEFLTCARCGRNDFTSKYRVSKHQMNECVGISDKDRNKKKENNKQKDMMCIIHY